MLSFGLSSLWNQTLYLNRCYACDRWKRGKCGCDGGVSQDAEGHALGSCTHVRESVCFESPPSRKLFVTTTVGAATIHPGSVTLSMQDLGSETKAKKTVRRVCCAYSVSVEYGKRHGL